MASMTEKGEERTKTRASSVSLSAQTHPFLSIQGIPIYFLEDWGSGIGGGLWSTGLALAHYFGTYHAVANIERLNSERPSLSVLELGSGNGFLAVCLAAAAQKCNSNIQELVVTDTDEHLEMIRETVNANSQALANIERITVMKHLWGEFKPDLDATSATLSIQESVKSGKMKFDLIIGSDVAYREELYDPLIRSLLRYSHSKTVTLIGVTMVDTTPEFFDRLDVAGLSYQKFADHLLEPEYRGPTFGIFVIQSKRKR